MATAVKRKLSGSTDGKQIKVTAISTPGITIHTAVTGTVAGTFDEIWLYGTNYDTVTRTVTIEFGNTTSPDDLIVFNLETQSGLMLVVPGLILQNGCIVRAFVSTSGSSVGLSGFVNSITD